MFDEQLVAAGDVGAGGQHVPLQMLQDVLFGGGETFAFGTSHPWSGKTFAGVFRTIGQSVRGQGRSGRKSGGVPNSGAARHCPPVSPPSSAARGGASSLQPSVLAARRRPNSQAGTPAVRAQPRTPGAQVFQTGGSAAFTPQQFGQQDGSHNSKGSPAISPGCGRAPHPAAFRGGKGLIRSSAPTTSGGSGAGPG